MYLQCCASRQLESVAAAARNYGIALYRDLAVGVESGGAEAWGADDYVSSASVGCPPDLLNTRRAGLGFAAALAGHACERDAYATFAGLLADNMAEAGALRIDHAMSLMRLFWIPRGAKPVDGAYVTYPFDDLLGILDARKHAREMHGDRRRPRHRPGRLPRKDGRQQHPFLSDLAVRARRQRRVSAARSVPRAGARDHRHARSSAAGRLARGRRHRAARAAATARRRIRAPDALGPRVRDRPASRGTVRDRRLARSRPPTPATS